MKNLKFNSLMAVLLMLPLCTVRGQSNVSIIPENESDTSIVRYWKNGISIVYACNKEFKNKHFLLVDEGVSTVLSISVPEYVKVNDFRILHDSVFVVGHTTLTGSPMGLFACFDIQDFYNGTGYYRWMVTLQTNMPDCLIDPLLGSGFCQNQITDVIRMAVFDSSGYNKIAYIAKNYVVGDTQPRVGVGCASYWGGDVEQHHNLQQTWEGELH